MRSTHRLAQSQACGLSRRRHYRRWAFQMFRSKTLFIVGAGASSEARLPTGAELKSRIAKAIDIRFQDGHSQTSGDYTITEAMRKHVADGQSGRRGDINLLLDCAWMIRDAMPQAISIDNYIDAHRDNQNIALVGKLGIVRCILKAERDSILYFDLGRGDKIDYNSINNTWFSSFFQMATESVIKSNTSKLFENISFITFNYDRCIEHFLYHALQNYYRVDETEAKSLVDSISIIHPYGQVGYLPWQSPSTKISFGGRDRLNPDELLTLATQVKTFTERVEDATVLQNMRNLIKEAQTIVFLGFAFHPLNMALISPEGDIGLPKRVFGTTMGMSKPDMDTVSEDIITWLKTKGTKINPLILSDISCRNLFFEYWRSIPR